MICKENSKTNTSKKIRQNVKSQNQIKTKMKTVVILISLWTLVVVFLVECIVLGFRRRFGLDLTMTSLTFTFMVLSHLTVLAINVRKSKTMSTKWRIALYFIAFQLGFIGLIICLVTNANIINDVWIILLTSKTLLSMIEISILTMYFCTHWIAITFIEIKQL